MKLILTLITFSVLYYNSALLVCAQDSTDAIVYTVPVKKNAPLSLIEAPAGFEKAKDFNGYIHYQASSAIIMTLIDHANYVKISEGMNDAFYAENQLKYIHDSTFVSNYSIHGNYYKLGFTINEADYIRYMVYAGDLNKTLWLNITFPAKLETLVEPLILESLFTIRLEE